VILRGELDVLLYDDKGEIIERINLNPETGGYGVDIPGEVWQVQPNVVGDDDYADVLPSEI
jgi:tellurite resistance-related uncharacterized protein